jgi:hypothetical protein
VPRSFIVDLWLKYADGTPSELVAIDLVGVRGRLRKRRLRALGDEFWASAEPIVGWRPGPEGKWIRFSMGLDTVFGQWRRYERQPWEEAEFRLKIMRVVGRKDCEAILRSVPPAG